MSTRREFLLAAGALVLTVRPNTSHATTAAMQEAIRKVVGDAQINRGKVKLDLPPLIDNGNVVALSVSVESPMTPTDYVKAIHVFNEKNPQPNIVSVQLGPRAGRASVSTRIRLADSQTVTAIAQLADGSFWQTSQDVIVTIAACAEEIS
ncbi:MAG TPA: SoxY-related AACIE arm protein [Burkholderiaceae bacterium]|jgi:sulfur-oxidizing protein SoxY|nr:SoxY-related AACIE arm protein [Burkholderiaceae bacterium]